MSHPARSDLWVREELLQLLSLSGNLAGLCVTVVALMHTVKSSFTASIIDDLFALCALLFLVSTYLIFSALRTKTATLARMLITIVDAVFLVGLKTVMTAAAFMMVYTVW